MATKKNTRAKSLAHLKSRLEVTRSSTNGRKRVPAGDWSSDNGGHAASKNKSSSGRQGATDAICGTRSSKSRSGSSSETVTRIRTRKPKSLADCGIVNDSLNRKRQSKRAIKPVSDVKPLMSLANGSPHTADGSGGRTETEAIHDSICLQLQALERRRMSVLKVRISTENKLRALTAVEIGYANGMTKGQRKKVWEKAGDIIDSLRYSLCCERKTKLLPVQEKKLAACQKVIAKNQSVVDRIYPLMLHYLPAIDHTQTFIDNMESSMTELASTLPAAKWADSIRGFTVLRMAIIVGNTGNLSNYSNPGKVWKRLGMAPYEGKMPSTWRGKKEGELTKKEWTEIGYSPKRRSVMHTIADCLVKLNFETLPVRDRRSETVCIAAPGKHKKSKSKKTPLAYRLRYDEAKASVANRKGWTKGRKHMHAMLLCAKRIVRDLWIVWNKGELIVQEWKQTG